MKEVRQKGNRILGGEKRKCCLDNCEWREPYSHEKGQGVYVKGKFYCPKHGKEFNKNGSPIPISSKMKIYISHPEKFFPETIELYKSFAKLTDIDNADLVVINDFEPIESTKPVACNSTGLDHIKAPEIISLRGEDLSDFTAVAEYNLCMLIYLLRMFKKEEIKGKTLGIIGGRGRIGKQLANIAEFMGMNVLFYDKKK